MNQAQARGRRTLILISLMFATPIAVAMYIYFSGTTFQPTGSTEHGQLIAPPIMLPEDTLGAGDEQFRKIWSLVVLTGSECDATCQTALVHIRQIRLSLGPKMTRMQTVLLAADAAVASPELISKHPRLIIAAPQVTAELQELFGTYQNGEVFMVDPLGNVMMRYAPGTDMGDIRKDIAHLFKLSGVG